MTRALLASTALFTAGLAISPAAADGVELGTGGFFRNAYLADIDDPSAGQPGALGFGTIRAGTGDGARAGLCVVAPGSVGSVPAFPRSGEDVLTAANACSGAGDDGDAQTLVYVTPNFSGFQLALSYGANGVGEPYGAGAGALTGATSADPGTGDDVLLYSTYSLDGDGWGLTAGAGALFAGRIEQQQPLDRKEHEYYQAGVNITFGNVAVGGVFEYFKALVDRGSTDLDRWVAGAGIAYTMDDWTVGAQYSRLDQDSSNPAAADNLQQDRVALTGNYELGPGVDIDGQVGYTWMDTDPDSGTANSIDPDEYPALEIGIGTNFTF